MFRLAHCQLQMEHQKETGEFYTASSLVDQLTDNPAAEAVAREIAERVKRAQPSG